MSKMLGLDARSVAVGAVFAGGAVAACYLACNKIPCLCKAKPSNDDNMYETSKLLGEYLLLHYGAENETMPYEYGPKGALDFPKRCADLCMKFYTPHDGLPLRALDIGCAVGRSSFEMTKLFNEVIGIDYSHNFVDACNLLKLEGQMDYEILMVGKLMKRCVASVDQSLDRTRATFQQGDACDLPQNLGKFECILAANLICRLHNPVKFLKDMAQMVAPGGILVITSPYSFDKQYTPEENWIGGFVDTDGQMVTGFDGLQRNLEQNFQLVHEENMPFFIRETERKNQWTVAHATVWRRNN